MAAGGGRAGAELLTWNLLEVVEFRFSPIYKYPVEQHQSGQPPLLSGGEAEEGEGRGEGVTYLESS